MKKYSFCSILTEMHKRDLVLFPNKKNICISVKTIWKYWLSAKILYWCIWCMKLLCQSSLRIHTELILYPAWAIMYDDIFLKFNVLYCFLVYCLHFSIPIILLWLCVFFEWRSIEYKWNSISLKYYGRTPNVKCLNVNWSCSTRSSMHFPGFSA